MVYPVGVKNQYNNGLNSRVSFGAEDKKEKSKCESHDRLMVEEMSKHPLTTTLKIQGNKLGNALTKYPYKGLTGSKNANFYEYLTMGQVPYLIGSAMLIAVFNLASKFFDTPAAVSSSKLGKKFGLGVVAYGLMKNISKKFIETPVKLARNIDINLPYEKIVYELPEERNKDNLVTKEYHKVFESVDFPYWNHLYGNKFYGEKRNAYFDKTAKKFGIDENTPYSDQKVKPKIRETVVKTRLFTTLSSYLWAAVGVGVAMQQPWEKMVLNPKQRITNLKDYLGKAKAAKASGRVIAPYDNIFKDFGKRLVASCKEFVNNGSKPTKYAGRALLGAAVGMTLLGNFFALHDFNKDKGSKTQASTSLIDDSKEKVIC